MNRRPRRDGGRRAVSVTTGTRRHAAADGADRADGATDGREAARGRSGKASEAPCTGLSARLREVNRRSTDERWLW